MRPGTFLTTLSILGVIGLAYPALAQGQVPRKDATEATKAANAALLNQLPFSDTSDFDDAKRGLIAPLPSAMVEGQAGNPIWNPQQYGLITEDAPAPDTVNPSLWRQSQLINLGGLFEVTDGIYQVRNQDLSNMTIIEGAEGITVVDPLISAETAKVAIDLYYQHRGQKPVKAVIYTHSHIDHYGGVRAVVDEADVASGDAEIYAPEGFLEEAVSENVFAGNAMSRRAAYMYGNLLPADEKGQVGAGLGMTTSTGTVTLIPPAEVVNHVVFADPNNQAAKNLQADALEQLGYQSESGPWRNFYLTGARELRNGVQELPTPDTASPDTVRAMSPEMFFDFLGVRLNSEKAGDAEIRLNVDLGGEGGEYVLELTNGVLNSTAGAQANDANATLTLSRNTLNDIILQQTTAADAVSAGDIQVEGDQSKLEELVSYLDTFEFWFDIVTPNATN